MLDPATRFMLASDSVGAKVIDGEAIILHADTGRYHSIGGAGAVAWEFLESGHSVAETSSAMADAYDGADGDAVQADIARLAEELIGQDVLAADDQASPGDRPVIPADGPGYSTPEVITFSDIEDLLALDPPVPLMGDTAWKAERGS